MTGECSMTMEAESEVLQLKVKDREGLAAATRSYEEARKYCIQSLGGSMALLIP